jgi:hypothetical protein
MTMVSVLLVDRVAAFRAGHVSVRFLHFGLHWITYDVVFICSF